MSLKDIIIQFNTCTHSVQGTFRALVSSSGNDILIVGNNESSIFFKFLDTEIKTIIVKHTGPVLRLKGITDSCLLYTSPSPRDVEESRMPSSA